MCQPTHVQIMAFKYRSARTAREGLLATTQVATSFEPEAQVHPFQGVDGTCYVVVLMTEVNEQIVQAVKDAAVPGMPTELDAPTSGNISMRYLMERRSGVRAVAAGRSLVRYCAN